MDLCFSRETEGPRILILSEGSDSDAALLTTTLVDGGFSVVHGHGPDGTAWLETMVFDLVIVDHGVRSGVYCIAVSSLCPTPIIVIGDDADVVSRIVALELGADDLIERPVHRRELLARARALVRRARRLSEQPADSRRASSSSLQFDATVRQMIGPTKRRVNLTRNESALLELFLKSPGALVTIEQAADILSIDEPVSPASWRTAIRRLRCRLVEAGFAATVIATVRGQGYVLDLPEVPHGLAVTVAERIRRDERFPAPGPHRRRPTGLAALGQVPACGQAGALDER